MMKSMLVLPLLVASAFGGAVELTEANYDTEVSNSGKAAFIKFLAPWCGHCKKMKPAWDQLGDDFAESSTVIIGDVDCTIEKDLCSRFGVRGYPTIKYFTGATAADGDKYEGGRDYESMKKWADENLGPSCGQDNRDLCDADQLVILDKGVAMSADELDAAIKKSEDAMAEAEEFLKTEVAALQQKYTDLNEAKDATIAELSPELRLLRSIKTATGGDGAGAKDEL